jgi:hypothetical protein
MVYFGLRFLVFENVLNFFSLNQSHENQNDGDNQKNVNEIAQRVAGNQSEQPGDDQNEGESVEHGF